MSHRPSGKEPITLAELDRTQIGNEIHDSVLPFLFASSAGLSRVLADLSGDRSSDQLANIQQVRDWIDRAQAASRQILAGTYPPNLERTTWLLAARDTLSRLLSAEDQSKIQWEVSHAIDAADEMVALAAYRIAVEACRNAIKHAAPDRINVVIDHQDGVLRICVTDDGVGFDPQNEYPGHYGLRSMAQRAESIGGQVLVDSRLGGPTKVIATLPYEEKA